jgi:uncharacterized membrane protein YgcG
MTVVLIVLAVLWALVLVRAARERRRELDFSDMPIESPERRLRFRDGTVRRVLDWLARPRSSGGSSGAGGFDGFGGFGGFGGCGGGGSGCGGGGGC